MLDRPPLCVGSLPIDLDALRRYPLFSDILSSPSVCHTERTSAIYLLLRVVVSTRCAPFISQSASPARAHAHLPFRVLKRHASRSWRTRCGRRRRGGRACRRSYRARSLRRRSPPAERSTRPSLSSLLVRSAIHPLAFAVVRRADSNIIAVPRCTAPSDLFSPDSFIRIYASNASHLRCGAITTAFEAPACLHIVNTRLDPSLSPFPSRSPTLTSRALGRSSDPERTDWMRASMRLGALL